MPISLGRVGSVSIASGWMYSKSSTRAPGCAAAGRCGCAHARVVRRRECHGRQLRPSGRQDLTRGGCGQRRAGLLRGREQGAASTASAVRPAAAVAVRLPDAALPTALTSGLSAGLSTSGPGFDIDRGGSVHLTFDAVDVRPQQQHLFPEAVLIPGKDVSAVRVEWSATSTSVSGVVRGSFQLPVVGEPWHLDHSPGRTCRSSGDG